MILIRTCSGLCNRLRTMAAGLRLAREFNTKCHVFWRLDREMNARFTDLFELPCDLIVHESEPESLLSRLLFNPRNHIATMPDSRDRYVERALHSKGRGLLAHTDFTDFYSSHDFSWLCPKPKIMACIENAKHALGEHLIGLHIRRTDNAMSIQYSPLSLFEAQIESNLREDPSHRFFLASDDVLTKKILQEKYGGCILTRSNVAARNETNGVLDAVIDLFLLSSCEKIYGSYYSSFSQTAAFIGNIPFEQLIIKGV